MKAWKDRLMDEIEQTENRHLKLCAFLRDGGPERQGLSEVATSLLYAHRVAMATYISIMQTRLLA